jgi:serine/threonine protein kinase
MKDFEVLSKLGEGSFGVVFRVRRKADGQEYAMKKVNHNAKSGQNCSHEDQGKIERRQRNPYIGVAEQRLHHRI